MTTLVVEELITSLSQDITVEERVEIEGIRPYLYKHKSPAGTFTMQILDGVTVLAEGSITSNDMNTQAGLDPDHYAHGYFNFELDRFVVLAPGNYTIKLDTNGYSFSEESYIGWIKEHENHINNFTTIPSSDNTNPYSLQLWSVKR